jgi:hypothetical protein
MRKKSSGDTRIENAVVTFADSEPLHSMYINLMTQSIDNVLIEEKNLSPTAGDCGQTKGDSLNEGFRKIT